MPSRALGPANESCVFLFLHRDREEFQIDYPRVVTEFLPEVFLHPMFLFLRPDGTEISPELRNEHIGISGEKIVKILKKDVWPETGKGLKTKDWKKAEANLLAAKEAIEANDFRKAERSLKAILKLKPDCGVKQRAQFLVQEIAARKRLPSAWDAASGQLPDAPSEIRTHLETGDLLAARNAITEGSAPAFEEELKAEIQNRFEMIEVGHQEKIMSDGVYYYLDATFTCGLERADELRVEFSVITDSGRVITGNAGIPGMTYSTRQMFCGSIPNHLLEGETITAVRARVFSDLLFLADKASGDVPDNWPIPENPTVGPRFYSPSDAWHVSRDLTPTGIRVGRLISW